MGCFQVNRWRNAATQGITPARDAKAPTVSRRESGEAPLGMWSHQVIAIEHRKIEKVPRHRNTNRMHADIFRAGPTKSVPVKSGHGIAAATLQFGPENVGWHRAK